MSWCLKRIKRLQVVNQSPVDMNLLWACVSFGSFLQCMCDPDVLKSSSLMILDEWMVHDENGVYLHGCVRQV